MFQRSGAQTGRSASAEAVDNVTDLEPARRAAFGRALASVVADRGLSQRALGELVGVGQSTASAWLSGEAEPGRDTVYRLEEVLDLGPGYLSGHLGYFPPAAITAERRTFADVVEDDPLLDERAKAVLFALYRELTGKRVRRRKRP